MKKALLTAGVLLLCLNGSAQHKRAPVKHGRRAVVEAPPAAPVFKYVEQGAAFNGDASEYLRSTLHYPSTTQENGAEGKTEVLFEITAGGNVRFLSIRRSSGYPSLDAEARRVVSQMPKWYPAKKQGLPVRTLMVLPVIFRLD